MTRAKTRLRVLTLLPQRHRDYFCEEIRRLCANYIRSLGLPGAEWETEGRELFSEVMAKLLGAASLPEEATTDDTGDQEDTREDRDCKESLRDKPEAPRPSDWSIHEQDPKRDGRVLWLIDGVGGRRALSHRYEDIRRRRWGRWQKTGYRTVQISALHNDTQSGGESDEEALARHADPSSPLWEEHDDPQHGEDVRRAWLGLLAAAERQFAPDDDVSLLLQLLAQDPKIQAGFGPEWPIRMIVNGLNARHPSPPWDDDRVDNAKRRLKNWIGRMKRDQGLDSIDLKSLFVRVARERERKMDVPPNPQQG
jgi:hypothetical protein